MNGLFITDSAQADLDQIWFYIAQDDPLAANRFLGHVLQRCCSYVSQPLLGEPRPEFGSDIRSFSVGQYYVVFDRPCVGGIQLVRTIHGARDIHEL